MPTAAMVLGLEGRFALFALKNGGIPVSLSAATGCLYYYVAQTTAEYVGMRESCVAMQAASLDRSPDESRNYYMRNYVYDPPYFRQHIVAVAADLEDRLGRREPALDMATRDWLAMSDHAMFVIPLVCWTFVTSVEAWFDYLTYHRLSDVELAKHFATLRPPFFVRHPFPFLLVPLALPLYHNVVTGGPLSRILQFRRPQSHKWE